MACAPVVRYGPEADGRGWPVYLGSPRHDVSASESLAAEPQTVWRTDAGRAIRGALAIGTRAIAAGTTDRAVVLLDRASGQRLWRRGLPGTVAGGPLIAGSRVYVATQAVPDGRVVALALRTGKPAWTAHTAGVTAPLALVDSTLVALTDAGEALALSTANGAVRWRRALGRAARATPVATPSGIVVATLGDSLLLLDTATGAIRARIPTPGTVLGTPATDGRRVVFGTTAGHLLAVALPTLTVQWDRSVEDPVYGAVALHADTVLALTTTGTLWSVPLDAPDAARHVALGLPATAGPTPVADGVLVGSITGAVALVNPGNGAARWQLERRAPIEEPPLVRDGELFVVSGGGAVEMLK